MAKSYRWQVAQDAEFPAIYSLLYNSELSKSWGTDDVKRRVILPLFLGQLVTFHDDDEKLCGFLTCAFMDTASADHQATVGIQPFDWQSGPNFWVVDLVAIDGGGDRMLRTIMRDLDRDKIKKVNYFRLKYREIREVAP